MIFDPCTRLCRNPMFMRCLIGLLPHGSCMSFHEQRLLREQSLGKHDVRKFKPNTMKSIQDKKRKWNETHSKDLNITNNISMLHEWVTRKPIWEGRFTMDEWRQTRKKRGVCLCMVQAKHYVVCCSLFFRQPIRIQNTHGEPSLS
mgnify:CR=1 FL=1